MIYNPATDEEMVQRFAERFDDDSLSDVQDTFISKCGMKCKVGFLMNLYSKKGRYESRWENKILALWHS